MNKYVQWGWDTCVPGSNGNQVSYFTPSPLSRLASIRIGRSVDIAFSDRLEQQLFASLTVGAILAERRFETLAYETDDQGSSVYADVISRRRAVSTLEDLLLVAPRLSGPYGHKLRDQMVFARRENVVTPYAIEGDVKRLVIDLLATLNNVRQPDSTVRLPELALLACLTIHPFLDGNGRLARFLCVYAGARTNALARAACLIGIQCWSKRWYESIALLSRQQGLQLYLEECDSAIRKADDAIRVSVVADAVREASRCIHSLSMSGRAVSTVLAGIASGRIDTEALRLSINCSARSAESKVDEILGHMGLRKTATPGAEFVPVFRAVKEAYIL